MLVGYAQDFLQEMEFQYHPGSINAGGDYAFAQQCYWRMFQYHPGSINADLMDAVVQALEGFQYHPGSINAEMKIERKEKF